MPGTLCGDSGRGRGLPRQPARFRENRFNTPAAQRWLRHYRQLDHEPSYQRDSYPTGRLGAETNTDPTYLAVGLNVINKATAMGNLVLLDYHPASRDFSSGSAVVFHEMSHTLSAQQRRALQLPALRPYRLHSEQSFVLSTTGPVGPLILVSAHDPAQLTAAAKLLEQQGHIDPARPMIPL